VDIEKADNPLKKPTTKTCVGFGPLGKLVLQSLPMGIVAFDSELRVVEANPQAAKLIKLGDYIDTSLAAGTDNAEKVGLNWPEELRSALSSGETRTFEKIGYTLEGKTRLLRLVCIPVKEVTTQPSPGGLILIEDIAERVAVQKQLANAERLATIGKLASKVAHELNDLADGTLRYINLATRIAEQDNRDKSRGYLVRCRQGLMRMVQIVSELLEFSRGPHVPLQYAKLEQIIDDAISAMAMKAPSTNIRISRNYAVDIPRVKAGNLFQVFCNIIKNAFDAMPDGGELHISTRLAADNTVVAEFCDTGCGFAPEHAEAIFEPFFTTKEKEKGTGLGLAICKDLIEKYQGRITAHNTPQGGSIFTVYLPLRNNV